MTADLNKLTKPQLIEMLKGQSNYLEVDVEIGHYILELPEAYNKILIFTSVESAIEYTLSLKDPIKPSEIKILYFLRGNKGYEINQVTGTDISDYLYERARDK
ncbi:hypothetical protein LCGC14_1635730 [marine sediment metagenome]|uniref:Uncharacterized protein n=1 Tax=marine sediment metagenome TaxID=412755 RepID=A0A0F9I191_9ZZZZ